MKHYAHTLPGNTDKENWEPLAEHEQRVVRCFQASQE